MILVIVPERRKVFQYSFQAGFLILERIVAMPPDNTDIKKGT